MSTDEDLAQAKTTVFGSAVLGNALSPQQWVEVLTARDLPIKERTLREKANRLGACCKLGNAMIITGEQMDSILTEPDLCPSNLTNTKPATISGSKVGSNSKGRGSRGHTCRWRVYSNAAVAARIADIGAGCSISVDLNEQDWHNAVAANWDGPLIVGQDGIRIDL